MGHIRVAKTTSEGVVKGCAPFLPETGLLPFFVIAFQAAPFIQ